MGFKEVLSKLNPLEEVPDDHPRKSAPPTTPPPLAVHAASFPPVAGTGAIAVAPDPRSTQKLEERIQKAAESLPAYQAFHEQYELLRDTIPDDAMRVKVAFKTSKTTLDAVAGAYDHLLKVLGDALAEFRQNLTEKRTKTIEGAKATAEAAEALIASRESQLKAIADEVASLRAKAATDAAATSDDLAKLQERADGFEAAHAALVARLKVQKSQFVAKG
jgi:hypothetical protein